MHNRRYFWHLHTWCKFPLTTLCIESWKDLKYSTRQWYKNCLFWCHDLSSSYSFSQLRIVVQRGNFKTNMNFGLDSRIRFPISESIPVGIDSSWNRVYLPSSSGNRGGNRVGRLTDKKSMPCLKINILWSMGIGQPSSQPYSQNQFSAFKFV